MPCSAMSCAPGRGAETGGGPRPAKGPAAARWSPTAVPGMPPASGATLRTAPARGATLRTAAGGSADAGAAAAHAAAAAAAAGRDGRREAAVLGGEDFILSQRSGVEEELFKGKVLGVDADVASVDYRQTLLRSLSELPEGLEAPQRFVDRVAVHYARNLLAGKGLLPGQVPLLLGIWGPKGVGKTFTLELCLRQMGVLPVVISAGELEDEWAGEPGRRLRERYSFAARHAETTGQPTCLVINDLDVGVGTFANTANTVNTQNLQGSLMALCDDPLSVSTGQAWAALAPRQRVPIYITANDLTCLYAPLVRDGRMDKFFFEPSREEMAAALAGLFASQLGQADVVELLDAFPAQPMDFFGSIKSRLVDEAVRGWLREAGGAEGINAALAEGRAPAMAPDISLHAALAAGAALAAEQQAVLDNRLSLLYMKGLAEEQQHGDEWREQRRRAAAADAARRVAAAEAAEAARRGAVEESHARVAEARAAAAEAAEAAGPPGSTPEGTAAVAPDEAEEDAAAAARPLPAPPTASGLPGITPNELAAALRARQAVALDVRTVREWDWGRIKQALHAPFAVLKGSKLAPEACPNPGFLNAARAKLGPPGSTLRVVLVGSGAKLDTDSNASFVSKEVFVSTAPNGVDTVDGEDIVAAAARVLQSAGYTQLAELAGGYRKWDILYRADGKPRARGAFRDKSSGELEWWTASN